jgi:RNA polymerase sigma-70 factor (ECF subfamily)
MKSIEVSEPSHEDRSAVAAVRSGDAERYRELVERHERRVYAVAWSRLGDAALAEEVTQEAFIRAYRRLWLLRDGAKFAGWIAAIARRLAINFGISRRRELNKRERWALEYPAGAPEPLVEQEQLHSPELLRQTLAELPAAHRECLVLFYLEGKSGAEAALTLGISEVAMRVRLHRARAELRDKLTERLEGSLEKLRPAKTVAPVVMAGVAASLPANTATAGGLAGSAAKVLSALGKTHSIAWLGSFIGLLAQLPGMVAAFFILRKERENFREADGFRVELHRRFFRSFLWGFPFFLVMFFIINHRVQVAGGIHVQQLVLAGFCVLLVLLSGRSLTIARNAFQLGMFAYTAIIAAGTLALALGWLPQRLGVLPLFAATVVYFAFMHRRPARMDYSLFLRAAYGLLKAQGSDSPSQGDLGRRELLAFARFLGARFLVSNFRWESHRLTLRLPPINNRFLSNMATIFMPAISQNCSLIQLKTDGTVSSRCGESDLAGLVTLKSFDGGGRPELEAIVAGSVTDAWEEFRRGNLVSAESILGELPESEVFVVPPARAASMRWGRWLIGACLGLSVLSIVFQFWHFESFSGMKPVQLTDGDVRLFMSKVSTNPNPIIKLEAGGGYTRKSFTWDPAMALFMCRVLPDREFFTSESWEMMRQTVLSGAQPKQDQKQNFWLCASPLGKRALTTGWLAWQDFNLTPELVSQELHANRSLHKIEFETEYLFAQESAWSWVESKRWTVRRANEMTMAQLRWLRAVNCLDLVACEQVIKETAAVQTLSATPPGNPPIHDWKAVRGLFFTPCYPALQDTWFALSALEMLGGLDVIDRQACIDGILRVHRGNGFFASPDSGGFNEYHIDGSAQDTIAAYESLRILGALDRVKDLGQWQFRTDRRHLNKEEVTWREIEAWVAWQRLQKSLRERKENQSAPFRSLLVP